MIDSHRIRGGCQCGAVRFSVAMPPKRVSVCHCRMCQRASGNVFAPLAEFANEAVTWEKGEPARFASSNIAERGFCAACGSPLFFRDVEGDTTEFMIGSLEAPEQLKPTYHYGVESRVSWLHEIGALPDFRTGEGVDDQDADAIKSHQAPFGDEG